MPEHYTKNTETATAWCKRCNRMTEHRIDGGRRGPCLDPNHPAAGKAAKNSPLPRAVIPKLDLPPEPEQGDLFGKKE